MSQDDDERGAWREEEVGGEGRVDGWWEGEEWWLVTGEWRVGGGMRAYTAAWLASRSSSRDALSAMA